MSTIFAVSSGRPPAGIAVIRISGPEAFAAVEALAGEVPPARRASLRVLRDAEGGVLDRALVLVFPGPDSVTGEDLAELHCHGGRAVVDAVERALAAASGLQRAEAGAFTRRALTNGRIDLAEAEGLADLLAAETERQRVAAMSAAEGGISRAIRDWLDRIAMLAARIEATLDFADEGDVEDDGTGDGGIDDVLAGMREIAGEIEAVLATPPIERLHDGVRVVLGGPPNSGKSTLINLLSDRDVAIVSPIAGTTRDRVEASVVRDGVPYVLIDTAGLTETDDVVERIGISRAEEALATADIVLWLGDDAPPRDALWLFPKADLPERRIVPAGRVGVSKADHQPIDALWRCIGVRAEKLLPKRGATALNRTQRAASAQAARFLSSNADDPIMIAEDLRSATGALATILGIDATEAMLDRLFGKFCIGK